MNFRNIDALLTNPDALAAFASGLVQRATVVELDAEIVRLSDDLRFYLELGRECNMDMTAYLEYCSHKDYGWLEICAQAIGTERGQRLGYKAGRRTIFEAREFARLQLANNAPFLGEVESPDDDC